MAHLVFFIAFMFYVLSLLAMCLLLCRSLRFFDARFSELNKDYLLTYC